MVNPDKLSILESQKVIQLLGRFKVDVSGLVVNRVLPTDLDDGRSGDFFRARRAQEETYLQEIDEVFARFPRVVVPLLRHDVHGVASLRQVGAVLSQGWRSA